MTLRRKKITAYGKVVKLRLCEKGMLQAELADMLGCSRQYLSRILSGERSGVKYSKQIEEILGEIHVEEKSDSGTESAF